MLNAEPTGLLSRVVAGIAGLSVIGIGVAPVIAKGDLFYSNWWGGLVFAPLAIVFGAFIIFCSLFKPEWLAARRVEGGKKKF